MSRNDDADKDKDKNGGDRRGEELLKQMEETKKKWDAEKAARGSAHDEEDEDDETDALLQKAMEAAIAQGRGWASEEERREYLAKITHPDFIPPIFASTAQEVEDSGLAEAFSSLSHEAPLHQALECKQKGNAAFASGKRNTTGNLLFYRDAINHYYEALAWAERIPLRGEDTADAAGKKDDPEEEEDSMTRDEWNEFQSTLCSNAAMAHLQLKNWGYARQNCQKALKWNPSNVKALFRLARALEKLQDYYQAGAALDAGLALEPDNVDLKKLQSSLQSKVAKARLERQRRQRARAERVSSVKQVWQYCQTHSIRLGRTALVATVTDDEPLNGPAAPFANHFPHSGKLPRVHVKGEESWPCLFLYPSHQQSDFVPQFHEDEMLALRMAHMFPELEEGVTQTDIVWDNDNQFVCSNLAVYVELYPTTKEQQHPELAVQPLETVGSAMQFYEAARALLGDEGDEMATVARLSERRWLHKQRKAWIQAHGSLWHYPPANPVLRLHPAVTLGQVLRHAPMMVPNFLVTLVLFPMNHPAHDAYLKEHKCLEVVQPPEESAS